MLLALIYRANIPIVTFKVKKVICYFFLDIIVFKGVMSIILYCNIL